MTVISAQGKDFSSYQRPVTAADLAGLRFAFVRVSDWAGTQFGTDPNFAGNWAQFRKSGLHRGAYFYLLPTVSPVLQAAYLVAKVKAAGLEPGDMLICDSEILTGDVDAVTLAFQREVRSLTGWPVEFIVTYSNENVGKHLVATSQEFPTLWLGWPSAVAPAPAAWAPAKWKTWTFWQWGEPGGVDANAFNGEAADLDAWVTKNLPAVIPPVHLPVPAPVPVPVTVTADGRTSLARLAAAHHTQPSGILRATAVADGLYPAAVAAWLNGVFLGTILPQAPIPAGAVLHIPVPAP